MTEGFNSVEELQDFAKHIAGVMVERHLFEMLEKDPIENYSCEQEHFIKHAPKWEIDSWVAWNKHKRDTNYNKFASSKLQAFRELGEVPRYIEFYLDHKYPGFWVIAATGPARVHDMKRVYAFFKRNPLFRVAEVV